MIGGSILYAMRGYPSANVDFFGPVIAYYTVAAQAPRRTAIGAGVALWVAVLASVVVSPTEAGDSSAVLTGAVIIIGVWLFGDSVRQRREYAKQLETRTKELEEARLELAAQAVTQERMRIARDLHDVVAHSISAIVVQASVARDALDGNREGAAQAIEHVEAIGRSAMGEVRQLLGVLRHTDHERDLLSPSPRLAELNLLIADAESSGITVEASIESAPAPVPAAVDLAAYRIVQEALTNVVRHAKGANVQVMLRRTEDALTIEIVNDVPGRTTPTPLRGTDSGGGLGIVGMRERVKLLGGSLDAGPTADGGFRVAAVLPLAAAS
jgi:signal transduction histidine kinase